DLFELERLLSGVEAELLLRVVLRVDLRKLAEAILAKLLLDRAVPANRLEHADGTLCVDDARSEAGNDLLVTPPRTGGGERRDRGVRGPGPPPPPTGSPGQ